MASYDVNNDIVGGGGLGFGGFGGGCGLLVVLLILFAVFSGGGLFGRHDGHHDDWHRDFFAGKFPCCDGTSNCQIDKDVLTSRDAGIIEQNKLYEKNLERKILERDMIIQEQKNQLFVGGMFGNLEKELACKFNMIEAQLERKPNVVPHYAKTVDACVQPQMNCFDRFREFGDGRRDRDRDDCCFC